MRVAGPTGVDIVLGTVSYALVQVGRSAAAYSGAVLPTVTARAPTPLIVLEDEVEQAEPPVTKAVVTRGISSSITRASKVAAVSVLAFSTLAWIPAPLSLSSPMSEITPLSIGCVLGPTHAHDVDTLVRESKRLGGHDRIVVWPESALQVEGKAQRTQVLETVTAQLGRQYGTLVAVGMESRSQESRLNEMVLVGRDGVMGEYSKQRLFPSEWVMTATPLTPQLSSPTHLTGTVSLLPYGHYHSLGEQMRGALHLALTSSATQTQHHSQPRLGRAQHHRLPAHLPGHLPPVAPALPDRVSHAIAPHCARRIPLARYRHQRAHPDPHAGHQPCHASVRLLRACTQPSSSVRGLH